MFEIAQHWLTIFWFAKLFSPQAKKFIQDCQEIIG